MVVDGLLEMADNIVADIAVDDLPRLRDVDLLQRAVEHIAIRLRMDEMPREICIADAARAREEMPLSLQERMADLLLDASAVVQRNEIRRFSFDMAVELFVAAAVIHPHHLIIGVKQLIRLFCSCDEKTTRQILRNAGESAQIFPFIIHHAFLLLNIGDSPDNVIVYYDVYYSNILLESQDRPSSFRQPDGSKNAAFSSQKMISASAWSRQKSSCCRDGHALWRSRSLARR